MKITKRQLRRTIKEALLESGAIPGWRTAEFHDPAWNEKLKSSEDQSGGDTAGILDDLLSLLGQAQGVASMIDQNDENATGQEGQALAAALQDIWVAFGGYPDEIFK